MFQKIGRIHIRLVKDLGGLEESCNSVNIFLVKSDEDGWYELIKPIVKPEGKKEGD
jgi:hypothetical protein